MLSIPLIDSATHGASGHFAAKKQIVMVLASFGFMFLGMVLEHRDLVEMSPWLYGINAALLVSVLVFGKTVGGSTRWINLGFFDLQPSEIAKVITILFSARYLCRLYDPPKGFFGLGLYYAWLLPPIALILRQPDLGAAISLLAIATGALYFGGMPGKSVFGLMVAGVLGLALVFALHVYLGMPLPLQPYQVNRVMSLFNPNADPLGTGYQVLQSRIAIGSGSLWGKGLRQGTQNRLDFIPEQHTDFIFSVVGEELGFVKSLLVLSLYFIIIYRCLLAAVSAVDRVGMIVAGSILCLFLFQVLVNVGMTMGIMPVTGVPLPFLSQGGTALLMNSFAIGMILNVGWTKHKILF